MNARDVRRRGLRVALTGVLVAASLLTTAALSVRTVEIAVDDEVHVLRTVARTVDAALAQAEVRLRPGDEVFPPADAPVRRRTTIEVARAFDVEVRARGGHSRTVRGTFKNVYEVLDAAGLGGLGPDQLFVDPPRDSPVGPGDRVMVREPVTVRISVDGTDLEVATLSADVAGALVDARVRLGPHDLISPTPGIRLTGDAHVVVRRVDHVLEDVEVALPREVIESDSDGLRRGVRVVEAEGSDGRRQDTMRVTLIDGRETARTVLDREVVEEPTPKRVLVGTYDPPPPGDPDERVLHLSFDDGPNTAFTPQVLDLLAAYDAQAVFFVVGQWVGPNAEVARRIADEGHRLGNHSWSHPSLARLSRGAFDTQITRTQQAIEAASGQRPTCLRPPYGAMGASTASWAATHDLEVVLWDVDPQDWRRPGADTIAQRILADTNSGDVVLLHDGIEDREQTVEALAAVLEHYHERGYRFTIAPGC